MPPSTNSENGITTTGEDSTIVFNNQPEEGGASITIIAAGISGGFIGIAALVATCICVGWLTKHVQIDVQYVETKQQQRKLNRQDEVNSNKRPVQINATYKQVQSNRQIINGIPVGLNQAQSMTRSQRYEGTEHETEGEAGISDNIAYHSNQRVHNQSVVSQLLIQQLPTISNDKENHYEYIL